MSTCPKCGGTGKVPHDCNPTERCPRCMQYPGYESDGQTACTTCGGSTRVTCRDCGGSGTIMITCQTCQGSGQVSD